MTPHLRTALPLAAALVGCSPRDDGFIKARDEYCVRVRHGIQEAHFRVEQIDRSIRELPTEDSECLCCFVDQCRRVEGQMAALHAYVDGFQLLASVLTGARPADVINEQDVGLYLGFNGKSHGSPNCKQGEEWAKERANTLEDFSRAEALCEAATKKE